MEKASTSIQNNQLNISSYSEVAHLVFELPFFYRREIDSK